MTLWLLRPAWVSFKSDRNCRLQKLWLADKAIWKETSNDACVCVGVSVCKKNQASPLCKAGRAKGSSHEISSNPICRHEKCHQGEMGCFQERCGWDVSAFVGRLLAAQRVLPVLQDNSNVSQHSISTSILNRAVPHSLFASSTHRQQNTTAKYLYWKEKQNKTKTTGKSRKREANL